jgi:hypothetical protein
MLFLWQYDETDRMTWKEYRPSPRWHMIPVMYEDELPRDISQEAYDAWYENSTVSRGVRIGPKI